MSRKIDRTGEKYSMLTFIRSTEKRGKDRSVVWELFCDCGNTTYLIARDVINGNTKSCGCLAKQNAFLVGTKNRQYEPRISSARAVWIKIYKDCDFDVFLNLSQKSCYYCGRTPHRTYNYGLHENGNFTYNGLDRIDSSKGHTVDNVVPCCRVCNIMKNDLSIDDFFSQIKSIYNHHLLTQNNA